MEIERINEDTLKVIVSKKDLTNHGLTFLDLLGDHEQIEKFFLGILDEADEYNEFRADNDSLTFQVMPNKDGLEIFIKKNELENESLDDFNDIIQASSSDHIKEANDELSSYSTVNNQNDDNAIEKIIEFHNFEDVIQVAKLLNFHNGASNLYLYNHHYYLDLIFFLNIDGTADEFYENNLAIAYEYGHSTNVTADLLLEHGTRIMKTSAVELIRYYFK